MYVVQDRSAIWLSIYDRRLVRIHIVHNDNIYTLIFRILSNIKMCL